MKIQDINDKLFDNEIEVTWRVLYGARKGETETESTVLDEWMDLWHETGRSWNVPGLGTVEHVESFGGEGEGDSAWLVISVTDEDENKKFFRVDGYHQSFDGSYLDGDLYEVTPAEKVVTVFEAVQ